MRAISKMRAVRDGDAVMDLRRQTRVERMLAKGWREAQLSSKIELKWHGMLAESLFSSQAARGSRVHESCRSRVVELLQF